MLQPQMLQPLCADGPALAPIVAGCWRLAAWGWTPAQTLDWIERCADLGVTSFDHADIYGGYTCEGLFGAALALRPALRERLQIVGKVGIKLPAPARPQHHVHSYDTSPAHILASVDNSLRELRCEHLDLLLIHRPDPLMDADAVASAFDLLRRAGKVRHFGASNFTPSQFKLLDSATPLCTNQIELHPLRREPLHDGTLDQAQRLKRRPMIWSPLAGGRLLGGDDTPAAQRVRWVLGSIGARLGVTPASVAHAWLLRHPSAPLPVVGTRRIEALQEALAATTLRLDSADWAELWRAGSGQPLP